MKTFKINDSRINRDNNFGGYETLSNEIIKNVTGYDKKVSGYEMSYNNFKGTAYKQTHFDDIQVEITLDFNTHTAHITYDDAIEKPEWMKELEAREK